MTRLTSKFCNDLGAASVLTCAFGRSGTSRVPLPVTWTIRRTLGDTCGAGRVTGRHAEDLPPVAGERTSGSWPGSPSRGMAAPALCVPGSQPALPGSVGRSSRSDCPRRRRLGERGPGATPAAPTGPRPPTRADPPRWPDPARPQPDRRVPSTSLAHVAALVRAAVPPMHPGGRPIVAGVAAAAGLVRLLTGRGALAGVLATAAVAAFFRNPHRVPPSRTGVVLPPADGTVALVSEVVPPPELDLPPGAGTARQRLPVGPRRARPADPGRRAGRRTSSTGTAASCRRTSTRPATTTSATRCCWRPSTAPASGRADRGPAGPADPSATSARATRWRRARPTG